MSDPNTPLLHRISRFFYILLFVAVATRADAHIDATLQMQLGNPSNAASDPTNHSHYLILRTVEAIDYNDSLGLPNWASWDLTSSDLGSSGRSPNFLTDTNLPPGFYQVTTSDYSGAGYDRGHMCPSADRTDNPTNNDLVFYMSNIIPQAADNNQGVWASFESYCRGLLSTQELLIICGPGGFDGTRIPSGKVAVPTFTWKIAVAVPLGSSNALSRITTSTRVIAIEVPNSNGVSSAWQNFVTSAGKIEKDTAFTFFTALPPTVASALRSKIDGETNPPPVIAGFSPTIGGVGTNVVVTGTNFDSASLVTLNGIATAFSVDSNSQLTFTVPTNASSGVISVTTPSGTATSTNTFVVNSLANPDLTLLATHSANFRQGDTGDTLSFVVTNVGSASSSGNVVVSNYLPVGLTATGISGSGWTTDLATLTCSRANSLDPSTSFPAIVITVNVATNAASTLTNFCFVSGGGDSNAANNTIKDIINVSPALVPAPDFSLMLSHAGNFVQGDSADVYTLSVSNVGNAASSGTVTVSNFLPTGLTAVALSGTGWTTNLATLTCSRSDSLAPGTGYPPITLTVSVASNAPGIVTNFAVVTLGGDSNLANNTAADPTTILPAVGPALLVGWDVNTLTGGQNNFGPSPYPATTVAASISPIALTRASGVGTNGTGAGRAWGGNAFTNNSAAAAITANQFVTFGLQANAGATLSLSSISKFDYRRSGTGPANGVLQYQLGSGAFTDITSLSYPSNTAAGGSIGSIDLSGIAALQNVGPGTNVTFRIVNYGGGSSGTWYIFDVGTNSAPDLALQGFVTPLTSTLPDLSVSVSHANNFTQGDTGDTYSVIVSNSGAAATSGSINVTNFLPVGLTATALGGAGWTANLTNLTCTRTDSLGAGLAYPTITLTVNVATNAPSSVTNIVSIGGGGETNISNNIAADVTTVTPLTHLQYWRLYWFGTTANSGAAADGAFAASDGLPNLVKYALGLNPFVPTNSPVVGDISTGYLRLTSPKNPDANDVDFLLEAAGGVPGAWNTNGIIIDQNTATLLQAHDSNAVSDSPHRYMRLRVSRP